MSLCSLPAQGDPAESTELGWVMHTLHCSLHHTHLVKIVDLLYGLKKEANTSGEALP